MSVTAASMLLVLSCRSASNESIDQIMITFMTLFDETGQFQL